MNDLYSGRYNRTGRCFSKETPACFYRRYSYFGGFVFVGYNEILIIARSVLTLCQNGDIIIAVTQYQKVRRAPVGGAIMINLIF